LRYKAEKIQADFQHKLAWSKRNDVFLDIQFERNRINQLWERIKVIKKRNCRNPDCARSIGRLNQKIYSTAIQDGRGFQKDLMYFCCHGCWNTIKRKFGLGIHIDSKQNTIDMDF